MSRIRDEVVGRFPYVMTKKAGFRLLRGPEFTHILGPIVDPGAGKALTQVTQQLSILRELIDKLPRFDFFKQACGCSIVDGLAFQERGFEVKPQYTFQIDCRKGLEAIWNEMSSKTRGHIRRAEREYVLARVCDPEEFIWFYLDNMKKSKRKDTMDFSAFPAVFAEVQSRESGEILSARSENGAPLAMVFLVWGRGYMYYSMSTRTPDLSATGAANLLLWSAIKQAHARKLVFDLDGVIKAGTARFYLGHGGELATRLVVTRGRPLYHCAKLFGEVILGRGDKETARFT